MLMFLVHRSAERRVSSRRTDRNCTSSDKYILSIRDSGAGAHYVIFKHFATLQTFALGETC